MVGVRLGEAGALHLLRGLGDPHRLVAVDLRQRVVERVGRVVRVAGSAPRVPQPCDGRCWNSPSESRSPWSRLRSLRLLVRRGQRDRGGPRRQPAADGDGRDQRGVLGLLGRQVDDRRRRPGAWQPSGSGSGPTPRSNSTNTPRRPRPRHGEQRRAAARPAPLPAAASVGVQGGVERDAVAAPRHGLDGAGHRVAAEQHVARAGELGGLDHLGSPSPSEGDLGAGGDVAAGLDHAVVAERDADAGVGAEQAALADRDDLLAAAGQGAHDRGAAADVGAVADDDAGA